MGTFGATTIRVPRARLTTPRLQDGRMAQRNPPGLSAGALGEPTRRSPALIYRERTRAASRRALAALFDGAVGKDTVSRVWRKTKGDWDVWNARSLADEPIVRLILDGTVVRVRLDKKATSISLLVALGVRADGQKVLLAIKNTWAGTANRLASFAAQSGLRESLKTPELVIVDGGSGLDKALAALGPDVPVQRCTVHKHRNLLAHAPDRLHEEVSADYNDLICGQTRQEIEANERPSSENGGSNAAPSPTAWRKQAPDCLLLPVSRKANGT